MTIELSLTFQTAYADLVDRCVNAAFEEDFSANGTFVPKEIKGRRYWYFQLSADKGRIQKYVGLETPELLRKIDQHKIKKNDKRDRRAVVSMLVRSAYLPQPTPQIGKIVEAISKAGAFRLRAVLVGTVAYQTYSATLGTRLAIASMSTGDVDVAQFSDVSIAVSDKTEKMFDVLKKMDKSFRQIPSIHDQLLATTYEGSGGVKVDFLTPNKGKDTDAPAELPALGTYAQQLRFLDFLIHNPQPAVLLHGDGVYVNVPTPDRYAIHKLIVSRRRREAPAKKNKDIRQAEALLEILIRKQPVELRASWNEAIQRGEKWRRLIGEGLGQIKANVRDKVLKTVGRKRSDIPNLDLQFSSYRPRYDGDNGAVVFFGKANEKLVRCEIKLEVFEDHFGLANDSDDLIDPKEVLRKFRGNRQAIEQFAREKYLSWPIEEPGVVSITTLDIPALKRKKRH